MTSLSRLSPLILLCVLGALVQDTRQQGEQQESCTGKTVDYSENFDEHGQCIKLAPARLSSLADLKEFTSGRERTAWRYKYVNEYQPRRTTVLIREQSIDERLANIIYTSGTTRVKFYTHRFQSGDAKVDELNKRLIAGPQVDDELCGRQLRQMLELMSDLERRLESKRRDASSQFGLNASHISLARVLDSFGRYQAGHLSGIAHSLGASDQCSGSQLIFKDSPNINMRFCWAQMSLNKHLDAQLKARHRDDSEEHSTLLSSGMCVPEACHTKSFEKNKELFQQVVHSQFKLPKSIYLEETLELESIYCLVDSDSQHGISLGGKLLLAALALWFLIAIHVTYKALYKVPSSVPPAGEVKPDDQQARAQQPSALTVCLNQLNLADSWHDFTCKNSRINSPDCKVDMDCLNLLKVLSTVYVVLGHTFIYWWHAAEDYVRTTTMYDKDATIKVMVVATFIVDSFFVLTGILLAYSILEKQYRTALIEESKERPAQSAFWTFISDSKACLRHIRSRYLRLMPLYLIVSWFNKFVVNHLSADPFWDNGFDQTTTLGHCKFNEGLFDSLSPLHGYVNVTRRCIPQGWSVSADLFFTLVAVPVIMLLFRKPKTGLVVSVLLCLASMAAAIRAFAVANPSRMWEVNELGSVAVGTVLNKMSYLYTSPHLRLTSMFAGVVAGYALFEYNRRPKEEGWPTWLRGSATQMSYLVMAGTFLAGLFQDELKAIMFPYHHLLYPGLCTTYRGMWAMANAVLLMRVVTDWKGYYFFRIGRDRFWRSAVKLSYVILLIHVDVILMNLFETTTSKTFKWYRLFLDYWSIQSVCWVLGIFVFVVLENPLDKLTRKLIQALKI